MLSVSWQTNPFFFFHVVTYDLVDGPARLGKLRKPWASKKSLEFAFFADLNKFQPASMQAPKMSE